ncbi:uncharacterized protein LOC100367794 [Saccoglossus kowalevskii]|uniref:Uncharacterized protein LOC100367794 n=1 Tax=Saccoglossus kowalevskii TaxID=10224 RepID=A0ABM0MZA0_SACKO|nr:PREDICTED: uncharacterized protein LOC100367794 [Saccoglossus kowalevskii]
MDDVVHFTKNKSLVMKAIDRYKELIQSETYQRMFQEKADPTKPDVIKTVADIHMYWSRQALEDCGAELSQIPSDAMIEEIAMINFPSDLEVLDKFNGMLEVTERLIPNARPTVIVGDEVPKDIEIVGLETETRFPLLDLHINKERPLLIIASSLS